MSNRFPYNCICGGSPRYHTITTFGHGDSGHVCFVQCSECPMRSEEVQGRGLFSDSAFREAQAKWETKQAALQKDIDDVSRHMVISVRLMTNSPADFLPEKYLKKETNYILNGSFEKIVKLKSDSHPNNGSHPGLDRRSIILTVSRPLIQGDVLTLMVDGRAIPGFTLHVGDIDIRINPKPE